jgi:hypothetical protein
VAPVRVPSPKDTFSTSRDAANRTVVRQHQPVVVNIVELALRERQEVGMPECILFGPKTGKPAGSTWQVHVVHT